MNFRQQQFRQAVQYQQHLDIAKTQSTLVKTDPTPAPEPVASTPEPVVEPAPVVVDETPVVETPVEPEIIPIPENRFENRFSRL
jgi:hypothetical protein